MSWRRDVAGYHPFSIVVSNLVDIVYVLLVHQITQCFDIWVVVWAWYRVDIGFTGGQWPFKVNSGEVIAHNGGNGGDLASFLCISIQLYIIW